MKKILVPVDGSVASQKAAEKAIELAEIYNSEITFVHVIHVPDATMHSRYGFHLEAEIILMNQQLMENGNKFLDDFVEKIQREGIGIQKLVLSGQPYEEILSTANEGKFDLIVMGRRGFSKIKRFFLGSVTQRVISDSPCPILVVLE